MTYAANAQETTYDASFAAANKEGIPINVLVGQSRVINFDRSIGRFSISNPEVAEAVMVSPNQVLVNGRAFGQVNFIAWEKSDQKFIVFDVFVRANLSLIDSQIRALFPRDDIRLSQANGSVVLSGTVGGTAVGATSGRGGPGRRFQDCQHAQVAGYEHDAGSAFNSRRGGKPQQAEGVSALRGCELVKQHSLLPVVAVQGLDGSIRLCRGLVTDFAGSALNLFLFNQESRNTPLTFVR